MRYVLGHIQIERRPQKKSLHHTISQFEPVPTIYGLITQAALPCYPTKMSYSFYHFPYACHIICPAHRIIASFRTISGEEYKLWSFSIRDIFLYTCYFALLDPAFFLALSSRTPTMYVLPSGETNFDTYIHTRLERCALCSTLKFQLSFMPHHGLWRQNIASLITTARKNCGLTTLTRKE
jgi:hypothetical protein